MKENMKNGFTPVEKGNPNMERNFNREWIESALMFQYLRRIDLTLIEFSQENKSFRLVSRDPYSNDNKIIKFSIRPLSDDLVSVENMKTKEVREIVLNNSENEHPDEDFFEILNQAGMNTVL